MERKYRNHYSQAKSRKSYRVRKVMNRNLHKLDKQKTKKRSKTLFKKPSFKWIKDFKANWKKFWRKFKELFVIGYIEATNYLKSYSKDIKKDINTVKEAIEKRNKTK